MFYLKTAEGRKKWSAIKKEGFKLFQEADKDSNGTLDAKEFLQIAGKLKTQMKDFPVPGIDGKERKVSDLSMSEFSDRLMEIVDANEDGNLEWEEFWVLYRQFFTDSASKKGVKRTQSMLSTFLCGYFSFIVLAVILMSVDFDGDGKPFLTVGLDLGDVEL